jgi:hypothetical protein
MAAGSKKLYATETRNPYEHLGSANADMIGDQVKLAIPLNMIFSKI